MADRDEWITLTQVVKSGKYTKIAFTHKGFNYYIKENFLQIKYEQYGKCRTTYLKRRELDELIEFIDSLESNYYRDKEVAKLLGFSGVNAIAGSDSKRRVIDGIKSLCNSEGIEFKYYDKPFKGAKLYINKNQIDQFLNTHICQLDVYKKYNLDYVELCYLERSSNITRKVVSKTIWYYLSDIAEKYFIKPKAEEFYTIVQVCKMFRASRNKIENFLSNEENLEIIKVKGKKYFLKSEIDNLFKRESEIKSKYCSVEETKNILNLKHIPFDKLKSFPSSTLMNTILNNGTKNTVFLREEVEKYKAEKEVRDLINQAMENDSLTAFHLILDIKKISFSVNSQYTKKMWFQHCKEKLLLTRSNVQATKALIKNLVDCTEYLSLLTQQKELYSFHSNEINLFIFNDSVAKSKQTYLYSFIIEYHSNVMRLALNRNSTSKTFDIKKVTNPYLNEVKEKPKELYSYDEYLKIYEYSKDMKHKQRSILDAENIIKGNQDKQYYSSAWLYVLIHLCNGWRHIDVISLTSVDLSEINIYSLETLKQRDLTLEEAECIVNQLRRKKLTVNKTGSSNQFYCADELVLPIATASVICTLILNKTTGLFNDSMINFGTKNSKFSSKCHNIFFKEFIDKNDGFSFKSLQMNRTVLVLIYMVLVKKGRGSAALEMAQRLRAHEDYETTNIYMHFPQEELDELCESLFSRKHFGFITDLLAEVIIGENFDRNDRTQEIIRINQKFGDIQKIEATVGFVNKILSERQTVADIIFNLGIDGATDLMFDLNANALPSRQENVQCLLASDGCIRPELENCLDCQYSVPNFLAISTLSENIKSTIIDFIEEYDPTSFEAEKTKLMNHLFIDMDNFERAIQRFGKSEVFKFFDGGEEKYNELLNLLDNIVLEKDYEKYLTYNPVYLN
ncbi:hypothetical protein [Gottfriedia acidiceleris]|uniref:hypothetical protein n=1 Tax=Gottfriedia acidiceleris TaxID=371036 RepID=UPI00101C1AB8|nr:hypothetical protein [Gottfriedia acidiceleris]